MEKLDSLPNGWPIWQSSKQFKFTLDAVLLAAFPLLKKKMKIMELGAGTGAVSLLLAARGAGELKTLDINEEVTRLFQKSIGLNQLTAKITAKQGDLKSISDYFPAEKFDLVVANPPYRKLGDGKTRKLGAESACHESTATTEDFLKAAKYLLKYGGKLSLVHLPERLPEIINLCQAQRLEPKRLQMVHSFVDSPPSIFLLEAGYGAKPGLHVLEPFFVYEKTNHYTEKLLACYQSFSAEK